MSRYRFPLDPVRRLRQARRDAQRERLAEALHAADILQTQQQVAAGELELLRQARRDAMQTTSPDVNRLLDTQRYELLLQAQLQTIAQQQGTLAEEVERRRAALAEAEQQVRVLDKLDERRHDQWRKEQLRREELVLGEIATQMYCRMAEDGSGTGQPHL